MSLSIVMLLSLQEWSSFIYVCNSDRLKPSYVLDKNNSALFQFSEYIKLSKVGCVIERNESLY